jgi:farnesyl-diphosphate farnesyltransferase
MSLTTSLPYGGVSDATDSSELYAFLAKTSRTFALTIPLLPEPLRTEIGVAYLLFRIIDTFEDATSWPPSKRVSALGELAQLLQQSDERQAAISAGAWLRDPPVSQPAYVELVGATPRVLGWYRRLQPAARMHLRHHLERSALGMCQFVERTDGRGRLQLETLQDLRAYCLVVAGIVGEMLTELFLLSGGEGLAAVASELRARAVQFGEALQLVNILKDAGADAVEGRVYLPRTVALPEVFALARADLRAAADYTDLLRGSGAHRGLVAFNAVNARLAIATLGALRGRGLGAKLTRMEVLGIAADVAHALDVDAPIFDRAAVDRL